MLWRFWNRVVWVLPIQIPIPVYFLKILKSNIDMACQYWYWYQVCCSGPVQHEFHTFYIYILGVKEQAQNLCGSCATSSQIFACLAVFVFFPVLLLYYILGTYFMSSVGSYLVTFSFMNVSLFGSDICVTLPKPNITGYLNRNFQC